MNPKDNLVLYHELLNCNYPLSRWEYDKDFRLIYTDYTENLFTDGFLTYTGLSARLTDYLADGKTMPAILELPGNLLWLCGFERPDSPQGRIHLIGPIFSGRDSRMIVRKRLDAHNLSVPTRAAVMRNFENIPALPSDIVSQYAVMLHYCLTQKKISPGDVAYLCIEDTLFPDTGGTNIKNHDSSWYAEQQLCKMIADGNPKYKEALSRFFALSTCIRTEYGDSLRTHKNNSLLLLTLCSRACIQGGLHPSISYDLYDYYCREIEECTSLTAAVNVCSKMMEDYVSRVQDAKARTGISLSIENSCAYIRAHIASPLSLSVLAKRVGYTEYYFSHKFKKEVGCSVTDFILREKITQARFLLENTNDTVQSVSDALSFSNRSYFSTCFKRLTGISPARYREENRKL